MKIALVALLAICATVVRAQDVSLKGIASVQVEILLQDGIGTGPCAEKVLAKSFGLLEDPIRTEAELRLREVGLRIGPGQVLRIGVVACQSTVNIEVSLKEWAIVDVRGRHGVVITWTDSMILFGPREFEVRSQIRDSVSKFVNQWLADNGK